MSRAAVAVNPTKLDEDEAFRTSVRLPALPGRQLRPCPVGLP